jgi:poly(glycerol-phosphate) alpha-glucosyltransferase
MPLTQDTAALPEAEFPAGRYLSCTSFLHPDAGGQTRAFLLRNATLARRTGLAPDIVSFVPARDFPQRHEALVERGLVSAETTVRNICEHYREHPWPDALPTGEGLADLRRYRVRVAMRPDGTPWRATYRLPATAGEDAGSGSGPLRVHDYLRADGTPFLRTPAFRVGGSALPTLPLQAVGPTGEVVGRFASPGHWFRQWVRELAGPAQGSAGPLPGSAERTFVFMDSRTLVPPLAELSAEGFHLIYLMHNIHLLPPRRWDSPAAPAYRRVLQHVGDLDALVTLTERQRGDLAQRVGGRSNLFVVPNPVDPRTPPPDARRDPHLVAVLARLEPQKQVEQAVQVFARVHARMPQARLEIYGGGSQQRLVRGTIRRLGLQKAVRLRGWDPRARDVLWRASALLSTSAYEGYPLSILESLSQGCPVDAYDVTYGPRAQIAAGRDGFVVPAGDVEAAADRVLSLLQSPERVEAMGRAGRESAARHGTGSFLDTWAGVLREVVAAKPRRVDLGQVALHVDRLAVRGQEVRLAVRLTPEPAGAGVPPAWEHARLELDWVDRRDGAVTAVPVQVRRDAAGLQVSGRARVPLGPRGEAHRHGHLRIRMLAENACWEARMALPPAWWSRTRWSAAPQQPAGA